MEIMKKPTLTELTDKTIVKEGRYSQAYIYFFYKLLLFRHYKNYSAQDVSYLLGKKSTYFDEIEELKSLPKRMNDIFSQTTKLGELNPVNLFSIDPCEDGFKKYRATKIIKRESIFYKMEAVEGGIETLMFALTENIPSSNHFTNMEEKHKSELRGLIRELLTAGYFSEKIESYMLYNKCRNEYNLHVRPVTLREAMLELIKEKENKLYLKYDNVDHYCFRYYYINI